MGLILSLSSLKLNTKNNLPLRWIVRITFSLVFAMIIGALPVYIHREWQDLDTLESELTEIKTLNKRLFVDLEDSVIRLRSMKTDNGVRRILREKGFTPPNSLVYQIETGITQ
jgi:hypothetical protein